MPQHHRVENSAAFERSAWMEMDDTKVARLLARLQSSNRALDELRALLEAADPARHAASEASAEPA